MVYNTLTLEQATRAMTGSAIRLTAASTPVFKVVISVPAANSGATVTVGGTSALLPIIYTKGASYTLDFSYGREGMRADLTDIWISGSNNDLVYLTYWF